MGRAAMGCAAMGLAGMGRATIGRGAKSPAAMGCAPPVLIQVFVLCAARPFFFYIQVPIRQKPKSSAPYYLENKFCV